MDGPPPDAYGRVTNPQRFASLHAAARRLIDELAATYEVDVSIAASGPADWPGRRRFDITTLCPSDDGARLQIALTDFPGVDVRFGAWISAAFPRCGCDACDEQPAEVAVELREFVDALIGGTYVEWWDGRRAGHRSQTSHGWSSGWGVVPADDPRHEVDPFTTQHRAWKHRPV